MSKAELMKAIQDQEQTIDQMEKEANQHRGYVSDSLINLLPLMRNQLLIMKKMLDFLPEENIA